jgi:dUTP pyrophosphatase
MSFLQVKIKKLHEKAQIPKIATNGSAGLDLVAISEKPVFEGAIAYIEYGTGLAISLPKNHVGLLVPRSSISSNTSLILANSVGILDSDFLGEIKFRFKSVIPIGGKKYNVGDRIGQLVIVEYPEIELQEVKELENTARGTGGWGSTGV